jgi:hypothetical protein
LEGLSSRVEVDGPLAFGEGTEEDKLELGACSGSFRVMPEVEGVCEECAVLADVGLGAGFDVEGIGEEGAVLAMEVEEAEVGGVI